MRLRALNLTLHTGAPHKFFLCRSSATRPCVHGAVAPFLPPGEHAIVLPELVTLGLGLQYHPHTEISHDRAAWFAWIRRLRTPQVTDLKLEWHADDPDTAAVIELLSAALGSGASLKGKSPSPPHRPLVSHLVLDVAAMDRAPHETEETFLRKHCLGGITKLGLVTGNIDTTNYLLQVMRPLPSLTALNLQESNLSTCYAITDLPITCNEVTMSYNVLTAVHAAFSKFCVFFWWVV